MSLIDFSKNQTAAPTARTANGRQRPVDANGNPLPQAKLWLNFGYLIGDRFISLPLGLPIDTMQSRELRGTSQEFLKLVSAQNDFLGSLQSMIETLNPGDEAVLMEQEMPNGVKMQVRLRRTVGEVAVEGPNDFAVDLGSLFAKVPVVNPANERAEAEQAAAG